MAFTLFKKNWQKIIAYILLVLTVLILVLSLVINTYWSPILAAKVKEVVLKSSDGLYTVNFSSAELQVVRGSIVIYNITLKPDTAVYNRQKKLGLAPNNLIQLHIKRLTLSHIHPLRLYFRHKLDIGEIVVNQPVLKVSYTLNHTKDTVLKDNKTPWQKISKSLQSVHISKILLGDVKFKYEDYSGNKVAISELKELNVSMIDLLIDSATQTDKTRLLYCKDIITQLNNYTGKTENGLYTYKINSLKLSTLSSRLNVYGLVLKPVGPNLFFNKTLNDRITVRLDSIQLNNFDFLSYHKYRTLQASSLILTNGAVDVFSNPKPSNDLSDKIKTFPNFALFKLKSDISIDTATFQRINVTYSELNDKSKETGTVSFINTNGKFLNITTNKKALQKNKFCTVQLSSYFMNRSKLNATFNFNLADKDNAFSYKGSLAPMDLKYVNAAAVPLGMVKIKAGMLNGFDFNINANRYFAKGKVSVLYNNLTVTLLKPDTILDKLKKKPIATLYANIFIVKHNNPDFPGGVPRVANVYYTRNNEIPFFKSLWQTLFGGIKPCAGLDKKTVDNIIALTNQQIVNKQNRKIKKELRIERRAERRKKRAEKQLLKEQQDQDL